jgi:aspartate kinase
MSRIVQKFGGTSVGDSQKILAAARKAIRAHQSGHQVVMVVSAMGKTTDLLIDLAKEIHDRPSAREMDMLLSTGEQVSVALVAMAVEALGAKATSLTGGQIGIRTDGAYTKARIRSISTERIEQLLQRGQIVIAAGFQGIDDEYNITTLGRGGSDTTAVALAAVLDADACEIYTDVDGVYTTDPRLLAQARKVTQISYDEMLELASLGAGVMHSRSIEFGKKFSVPIHVRSSFSDAPGSYIVEAPEAAERAVSGAALTRNEARVTVANVPDRPGVSHEIFSRVASHRISLDMIVQDVGQDGMASISFTVPRQELALALEAVDQAVAAMGPVQVSCDQQVAKVSVVGLGMARQSGVAARMFAALAREQINIQMITSSAIKISALVTGEQGLAALRAVHQEFELHLPPPKLVAHDSESLRSGRKRDLRDLAQRMGGIDMEELFLEGIDLDLQQGRVTVRGIPDEPGVAAAIFGELAQQKILVDTVVQSFHPGSDASLSFTLHHDLVPLAVQSVRKLSSKLPLGKVEHQVTLAKVSVSGIGLRSHTGVAERMFRALAQAGINVNMINTSEVRVTAMVDAARGPEAMRVLEQAFADVLR